MKLRRYQKKFDFSYTLGVFPTLALFQKKPGIVRQVLLHFEGDKNKGVSEIKRLCKRHRVTCDYSPKAIGRVSAKENTYVVGVFEKYTSELEDGSPHVVLHKPGNPGNMGTIIRTMIGLGYRNLAIIKPAVDIFDPKVVRSTMGSVFDVNFEYFNNLRDYKEKYGKHNLYLFRLGGKTYLKNVSFETPYSLVFGNESSGLSSDVFDMGVGVRIYRTRDIDSYNLSVASAMAMYTARLRDRF